MDPRDLTPLVTGYDYLKNPQAYFQTRDIVLKFQFYIYRIEKNECFYF